MTVHLLKPNATGSIRLRPWRKRGWRVDTICGRAVAMAEATTTRADVTCARCLAAAGGAR